MLKFLRILLILGALLFIFLNVYVATLPSFYTKEKKIVFNSSTLAPIKKQIIDFENWENWMVTESKKVFVSSNKNPLLRQLKVEFDKKGTISIENQVITDSLIIQRIYGLGGKKGSTLEWRLLKANNSDTLMLRLNEYIGLKEKVLRKLKKPNLKSQWLYKVFASMGTLRKHSKKKPKIFYLPKTKPSIFNSVQKSNDSIIYLQKQN